MWSFIIVLYLSAISNAQYSSSDWEDNSVVPEVIDCEPPEVLQLYYRESNKWATLGNILFPNDTVKHPELTWTSKNGAFYTLLMVDPDAPSHEDPYLAQWRHWSIGNIRNNDLDRGDVLSGYIAAAPPKNTGLHRFVFLIYKQPHRIKFDEERIPSTSTKTRPHFNVRDYAAKYNLGEPIAGNFFQAAYDDNVPAIAATFSDS